MLWHTSICNDKGFILFNSQSGLTSLHLAAQEDKVNVADMLIKHGANKDAQTKVQQRQ